VFGGEFTDRPAAQRFHGLKTYSKFGPVEKLKMIALSAD
jgi:hypothetical protein